MAGQSVAASGRNVSVFVARTGRAEVRSVRMPALRGAEGVVRWAGVREAMDFTRVWVFERGTGGGVVLRGGVGGSLSSGGSEVVVGSGGGEDGGASGRVLASRFERRREARSEMVVEWYACGRVVVSLSDVMA